ncbi:hypothetical protein KCP76_05440 [Salmonella enterica subsp. enterica serovar Weltevreden]|nr:hypothetical protein KCP76_05440 [Salmonella enterica subsp. enterica serovar Weltevreden]
MITHGTGYDGRDRHSRSDRRNAIKLVVASVGAMRPSTSMSADGLFNLYNAVV